MQPLLDAIVAYVPSPAERPVRGVAAGTEDAVDVAPAENAPASAFIWKTVADPFAGRITMFRVVTGCAESGLDRPERHQGDVRAARPPRAAAGQDADAGAGDQGGRPRRGREAQGKPDQRPDRRQGAGVLDARRSSSPSRCISYAIEPKSRGDEEKISTALHRLQEEDPTINYTRDAQTKELLLAGQGQSHIEVTVAKLKRRFGVEVNLKLPRIPYRETITASTEAHGRHKKQTGGHGQFGDCKVKFEPLPRGSRLRVRRRHLRRIDSAPVHPGGREGHPGRAAARLPRRLPDGRFPRDGVRRLVPRGRLERAVVQDGRRRWRSRTACRGRGRRCSNRSWTSRSTRRATTPAT